MKQKILFLSLLLLLAITLVGCSGPTTSSEENGDLVGSWKNESGDVVEVFTFNSDGTYEDAIETSSKTTDEKIQSESTGTYTIDGDSLLLTEDSVTAEEGESTEELNNQETAKYSFTIKDDTLTLEDANGYTMEFVKE